MPRHILPLQASAYDPEVTGMRQDYALGLPSRARRVQEHGRLCRGWLHCSERSVVQKNTEALPAGVAEINDRQISRAVRPSPWIAEHQTRVAVPQHNLNQRWRKFKIDRHRHQPGAHDTIIG